MKAQTNFAEQYEQAKKSNVAPYFCNQTMDIDLIMEFETVIFWIGIANVELTKTQRKKIMKLMKDFNSPKNFIVDYKLGENGRLIYCNVIGIR